jgi:hypothetical protein
MTQVAQVKSWKVGRAVGEAEGLAVGEAVGAGVGGGVGAGVGARVGARALLKEYIMLRPPPHEPSFFVVMPNKKST